MQFYRYSSSAIFASSFSIRVVIISLSARYADSGSLIK
jgi:hypothetical protein